MDFINTNNKRARDILDFSNDNIIDNLKGEIIKKLKKISPNTKGEKSIKYLNQLKDDFTSILSTTADSINIDINDIFCYCYYSTN